MKRAILAIAMFALYASPALAKHHHVSHHQRHYASHHIRHHYAPLVSRSYALAQPESEIVAHPAGCPRVAFCGCGASVEVFGRSIRELWLAANWFKFPHASPGPGMVAVRQHHVFVIRSVNSDGTVLAYDANSGGHMTRIHTVSLAGYSVRNPRGGSVELSARSYGHEAHYANVTYAALGGPGSANFGAAL